MRCSRDITQFSSHLRFGTEVLNVVRTLNYYKVIFSLEVKFNISTPLLLEFINKLNTGQVY